MIFILKKKKIVTLFEKNEQLSNKSIVKPKLGINTFKPYYETI